MKIELGYEDVYFGDFHPVEVIEIDTYDRNKIIKLAEERLHERFHPYIAWKVVK